MDCLKRLPDKVEKALAYLAETRIAFEDALRHLRLGMSGFDDVAMLNLMATRMEHLSTVFVYLSERHMGGNGKKQKWFADTGPPQTKDTENQSDQ